jgi:hypothetical protein
MVEVVVLVGEAGEEEVGLTFVSEIKDGLYHVGF